MATKPTILNFDKNEKTLLHVYEYDHCLVHAWQILSRWDAEHICVSVIFGPFLPVTDAA